MLNLLLTSKPTDLSYWATKMNFNMDFLMCLCAHVALSKPAACVYIISLSKYFPYLFFFFAWPLWDREGKQRNSPFLTFFLLSQPSKSHYRSSERRRFSRKLNIQLCLLPREGSGGCFILMTVSDLKVFTIHQLLPTVGQRIKSLYSRDRNVIPSFYTETLHLLAL